MAYARRVLVEQRPKFSFPDAIWMCCYLGAVRKTLRNQSSNGISEAGTSVDARTSTANSYMHASDEQM
eukprot:1332135-Pleurochrysis_carterae.AAC.1